MSCDSILAALRPRMGDQTRLLLLTREEDIDAATKRRINPQPSKPGKTLVTPFPYWDSEHQCALHVPTQRMRYFLNAAGKNSVGNSSSEVARELYSSESQNDTPPRPRVSFSRLVSRGTSPIPPQSQYVALQQPQDVIKSDVTQNERAQKRRLSPVKNAHSESTENKMNAGNIETFSNLINSPSRKKNRNQEKHMSPRLPKSKKTLEGRSEQPSPLSSPTPVTPNVLKSPVGVKGINETPFDSLLHQDVGSEVREGAMPRPTASTVYSISHSAVLADNIKNSQEERNEGAENTAPVRDTIRVFGAAAEQRKYDYLSPSHLSHSKSIKTEYEDVSKCRLSSPVSMSSAQRPDRVHSEKRVNDFGGSLNGSQDHAGILDEQNGMKHKGSDIVELHDECSNILEDASVYSGRSTPGASQPLESIKGSPISESRPEDRKYEMGGTTAGVHLRSANIQLQPPSLERPIALNKTMETVESKLGLISVTADGSLSIRSVKDKVEQAFCSRMEPSQRFVVLPGEFHISPNERTPTEVVIKNEKYTIYQNYPDRDGRTLHFATKMGTGAHYVLYKWLWSDTCETARSQAAIHRTDLPVKSLQLFRTPRRENRLYDMGIQW